MVLCGNSAPARSSRWFSDSGTSIIVERITAFSFVSCRFASASGRARDRAKRLDARLMLGAQHRHDDQRLPAVVALHAVAQPPFLDEPFVAVEPQCTRIPLL